MRTEVEDKDPAAKGYRRTADGKDSSSVLSADFAGFGYFFYLEN